MSSIRALIAVPIIMLSGLQGALAQDGGPSRHSLAFITNWGDDKISLIDAAAGKELAVIRVGSKPYDVKVENGGRLAYVTNSGAGTVSVIDIQAMLEATQIPVGLSPRDIAISKAGDFAVVANAGENTVSYVDLKTRKEVYRVKVGAIPYGVALTDNEDMALITNWGENTLSLVEIGPSVGKVVGVLPVGSLPYTVVTPQGSNYAFVSNFGSHSVTVVDIGEKAIGAIIPVGASPWGVATKPNNGGIAVANFYSGTVSLINTVAAAEHIGKSATLRKSSVEKVSPTTTSIAGANSNLDKSAAGKALSVEVPLLDEKATGVQVLVQLPKLIGEDPTARRGAKNVAFSASGETLLITDLAANRVLVLSSHDGRLIRSIPVGQAPYGIAFLTNGRNK